MSSSIDAMRIVRTRPRPASSEPHGDYRELALMVRRAGLLNRRHDYYGVRLIALPVIIAASVAAFILIGDTWWQMFTAAAAGLLFTQAAFLGHDAAHRQIFTSPRWNTWTSLVVADLVVGLSVGWWQKKHTAHHLHPNQEGKDPDIEMPVIAVTADKVARTRSGPQRWLMAHQGALFFPLLMFEGLSLHASSLRRVLSPEPVPYRAVEMAFLTLRLGGLIALVFLVLSPGVAGAFLGVQLAVFGVAMGASFAPNHKGMPIVPRGVRLDFLTRQVMMSRNVRGGRVVDVLMGGLNYQVEHHLFPTMPRPHLRRAAPLVQQYCRDRGIPYTQAGLIESYAIVIRYINRVGLGERDVFSCPLMVQRASV